MDGAYETIEVAQTQDQGIELSNINIFENGVVECPDVANIKEPCYYKLPNIEQTLHAKTLLTKTLAISASSSANESISSNEGPG